MEHKHFWVYKYQTQYKKTSLRERGKEKKLGHISKLLTRVQDNRRKLKNSLKFNQYAQCMTKKARTIALQDASIFFLGQKEIEI